MKRSSLMTIRWIVPLLAVSVMSVTVNAEQVLFDTGFSLPVVFNGTSTNLGWTSGNASATQPERWSAQPFSLPDGNWLITQVNAEYFVPAAVPTDIAVRIWNRTGEAAPTEADEVFNGLVPNPGGEGNDLWAALSLGSGIALPGGDYYLSVYGVDSAGGNATIAWFTGAPDGINFLDAVNNNPYMWRSSTYPAPGFEVYQLDLTVLGADMGDPEDTYNAGFQIIGVPEFVVCPDSVTTTRGLYISGDAANLGSSNNVDYVIQRSGSDTQARTEFQVVGTSRVASPTSLDVRLEGAVFARSTVVQTIELFDYVAGDWELVDTRNATNMVDSVATASATGDLSRFVDATTMSVEARVRFQSSSPRQRFSSNTDQFIWTIQ